MRNEASELISLLSQYPDAVNESGDVGGDLPLHTAAKWDRSEMATLLIKHGANVDATNLCGLTPLHCAASSSAYATAQVLMASGASTRLKAADGRVAYELAKDEQMRTVCGGGSLTLLDVIGGDEDDDGDEEEEDGGGDEVVDEEGGEYGEGSHKRMSAREAYALPRVSLLLDRHADANAVDAHNCTPLHLAGAKGWHEVRPPTRLDARACICSTRLLWHALALARTRPYGGPCLAQVAKLLLASRANPAHVYRRQTCLHVAAHQGDARMVSLLLGSTTNGADGGPSKGICGAIATSELLQATGRDGWTALGLAVRSGNVRVVKALVKLGASSTDIACSTSGKTALEVAAANRRDAILDLLASQGSNRRQS